MRSANEARAMLGDYDRCRADVVKFVTRSEEPVAPGDLLELMLSEGWSKMQAQMAMQHCLEVGKIKLGKRLRFVKGDRT